MSGTVIVGIDGDAGARDAFALGLRFADLLGAPLDIVSGAAPGEGAAMIVLGGTHRHPFGRTLRGAARRVLRDPPCPVAIAPAGFADRPATALRRIGVGLDPTRDAHQALEVAHGLAARAGGSLLAIGVVLPLSRLEVDDPHHRTPYLEEECHLVQVALEHALADLPAGVPCLARAQVGNPAGELAATAGEVDLLVCGSRGRGPLRALLGSVTRRLLRSAACPVLIVPSAGEPRAQARPRRRTMRAPVLPPPRG
jgi:nucleotide-binding universal stress UspA family protein